MRLKVLVTEVPTVFTSPVKPQVGIYKRKKRKSVFLGGDLVFFPFFIDLSSFFGHDLVYFLVFFFKIVFSFFGN